MICARRRSLTDMKLLLTSAGIKNPSIQHALATLLGKPIADCDALCIPTGLYGHPYAGPLSEGNWKLFTP
jgi:dipeptidase E